MRASDVSISKDYKLILVSALAAGWKDPALTEQGHEEALKGAKELKKYGYTSFDLAFTSALQRAQNTLAIQLKEIGQEGIPTKKDQALNERDYGDLTGLNKDDARKKFGEEQVRQAQRTIPNIRSPSRTHRSTSGAAPTTSPLPAASPSS